MGTASVIPTVNPEFKSHWDQKTTFYLTREMKTTQERKRKIKSIDNVKRPPIEDGGGGLKI